MKKKQSRPSSIFSAKYLEYIEQREPMPSSTYEAGLAGPFQVELLGNEYCVVRGTDGAAQGVTMMVDLALLIAAALPMAGRGTRYWCRERESDGSFELKTVHGPRGSATVGQLKYYDEEVLFALSALDHLVKSPTSLAYVIEAASSEALIQVDAILKRLHETFQEDRRKNRGT